jgi:hypothetical protein
MKTEPALLDLEQLTFPGNLAFSGRPLGVEARGRAELDEKDGDGSLYEVRIPEGTVSFTPSFFLGMFDHSVMRLGERDFRKKYRFVGENFDHIIAQGIGEALVRQPVPAFTE